MQRMMEGLAQAARVLAGLAILGTFFMILRHIAILMEFVTVGPLGIPGLGRSDGFAIYGFLERLGLGLWVTADGVRLAGVALVFAGTMLTKSFGGVSSGEPLAIIVFRMLVALSVLAYSYRFLGFVAVVGLFVWQMTRRRLRARERWAAWAIALGLCLVPYDVSWRNLEGPARFESSLHCVGETAAADYLANRRVCVGSDAPIFNEPTHVWVW